MYMYCPCSSGGFRPKLDHSVLTNTGNAVTQIQTPVASLIVKNAVAHRFNLDKIGVFLI